MKKTYVQPRFVSKSLVENTEFLAASFGDDQATLNSSSSTRQITSSGGIGAKANTTMWDEEHEEDYD